MSKIAEAIERLFTLARNKTDAELCDAAEAELKDAAEMLRELEWHDKLIHYDAIFDWQCPICGNTDHQEHAADCRLAALLERLDGNKP